MDLRLNEARRFGRLRDLTKQPHNNICTKCPSAEAFPMDRWQELTFDEKIQLIERGKTAAEVHTDSNPFMAFTR